MPRKKKGYDLDWFPLEAHFGRKMFMVSQMLGNDGFSVWMKSLIQLGQSHLQGYDFENHQNMMYLSSMCNITPERFAKCMDYLAQIEVFNKELWEEHRIIFSEKLVESVELIYNKRRIPIPTKELVFSYYRKTEKEQVKSPKGTLELNLGTVVEEESRTSGTHSTVQNSTDTEQNNSPIIPAGDNAKLFLVCDEVRDFWNSKPNTMTHKKPSEDLRSGNTLYETIIKKLLKTNTLHEIKQSIANYDCMNKNPEYELDYKWTLPDFLHRHFEKFADWETCHTNWVKKKRGRDARIESDTREVTEFVQDVVDDPE